MCGDSNRGFAAAWSIFLLEWQLAKHYPHSYLLYAGHMHRNPLLERLLPSLLYIKAVALLDEGLIEVIAIRGLAFPNEEYNATLRGRIEFLKDQDLLANAGELHQVHDRRNILAHNKNAVCTWNELEQDITKIEGTLQAFGIVGARPKLDYYGERSAMRDSEEPGILAVQEFKVGIKENDRPGIEFSWTEKLHKDGD